MCVCVRGLPHRARVVLDGAREARGGAPGAASAGVLVGRARAAVGPSALRPTLFLIFRRPAYSLLRARGIRGALTGGQGAHLSLREARVTASQSERGVEIEDILTPIHSALIFHGDGAGQKPRGLATRCDPYIEEFHKSEKDTEESWADADPRGRAGMSSVLNLPHRLNIMIYQARHRQKREDLLAHAGTYVASIRCAGESGPEDPSNIRFWSALEMTSGASETALRPQEASCVAAPVRHRHPSTTSSSQSRYLAPTSTRCCARASSRPSVPSYLSRML